MEGAVLKFAKAVDTDLSRASAFAGAALRIFNKDASETEDVLATFAVATTKTALDFSKLESSLSTVGPVANSFGFSIEDTTALLGQLANAGFDASSAATATRNIILNLCDANGDLAKALGSPVKNADDLAKGLKKLNAEGIDLAKALDLTDKRSVAAFSTFLNSADSLTELRDSITDVNKQFNDMSATMSDNVAGAMAGLQSAAQELVLKISEGTNGPIKDLIKALTSLVQWVGEAYQWLTKFGGLIKGVAAGFAAYKLPRPYCNQTLFCHTPHRLRYNGSLPGHDSFTVYRLQGNDRQYKGGHNIIQRLESRYGFNPVDGCNWRTCSTRRSSLYLVFRH